MGELMSYSTWKKKHKPQMMQVNDNVWGRTVMIPTLRNAGFTIDDGNQINDIEKPKGVALDILKNKQFTIAVYHKWKTRCGWPYYVLVAYK